MSTPFPKQSNTFDKNQPGLLVGGQVIPLKYLDPSDANDGDVVTFVGADGIAEWQPAGGSGSTVSYGATGPTGPEAGSIELVVNGVTHVFNFVS